jgi:hypothetical protein
MKKFKEKLEKVFSLNEELDYEMFDRMESITPQPAMDNLIQAASEIAGNLLQEGFDKEDIIEFINSIVEPAVTKGMDQQ